MRLQECQIPGHLSISGGNARGNLAPALTVAECAATIEAAVTGNAPHCILVACSVLIHKTAAATGLAAAVVAENTVLFVVRDWARGRLRHIVHAVHGKARIGSDTES